MEGIWILTKSGTLLTLTDGILVKPQENGSILLVSTKGGILGEYTNSKEAGAAFDEIIGAASSGSGFVDLRKKIGNMAIGQIVTLIAWRCKACHTVTYIEKADPDSIGRNLPNYCSGCGNEIEAAKIEYLGQFEAREVE